jgi:DNA-directed RNA polymerase subunit RPC12/RpoP
MILDQAGNLLRHGFPESLTREQYKITKPREKEDNPPPMKICDNCEQYCYSFLLECPHCGYKFPVKEKKLKVSPKLEAKYPPQARKLRQWVRLAFKSNYKPSYPLMRFKEEFKEDPIRDWYRGALYPSHDHESLHQYCHYLLSLVQQGKLDGKLLGVYLKLEFDDSFIRSHAVAIPDEFYT